MAGRRFAEVSARVSTQKQPCCLLERDGLCDQQSSFQFGCSAGVLPRSGMRRLSALLESSPSGRQACSGLSVPYFPLWTSKPGGTEADAQQGAWELA